MKKILIISPQPFFQWRGSSIRVYYTVLALTQSGYDVDLLTLPIGESRDIPGARILRVGNPFNLKQIPIGPSVAKLFFDILILCKGLRLIMTNRYAIVHGVEEAGIIAVLLAKCSGAWAIYEKHSDPGSHRGGRLKNAVLHLYSAVERLAVRWSDAVIGTGVGLVRQVEKMRTETRAFHVFDIPSSLEEPCMVATRSIQSDLTKNDEVLVTYVGSFAPYQGLEMLFAAIPKVVKVCPRVKFVIIGGSSDEIRRFKAIFETKGIGEHVAFLGRIAPNILPNYLAASNILLSPRSNGVNTPLKLLDYLKVGRAIVATDVPANRLILDDTTAMLVASNADSFSQGILSLVEDEQHRQRLGEAGKTLCRNRYNFVEYSRRLAACYEYVAAPAKGPAE